MELSVSQIKDVSIVRVKEAKLTYPVLSSFFAEVRKVVDGGARKLVLDLEAVNYIDSVFIGCLIDIHRLLEHRAGVLKVSGPQPRVGTMLSMTGIQKIVEIHTKASEAVAAFAFVRYRSGLNSNAFVA